MCRIRVLRGGLRVLRICLSVAAKELNHKKDKKHVNKRKEPREATKKEAKETKGIKQVKEKSIINYFNMTTSP